MKKAIALLGLLLALFMLSGCTQPDSTTVEAGDGTVTVTGTGGGQDVTITADDGDAVIQGHIENADDWCQAGSNWTFSGAEGGMSMVIVGLVESGEFAGYCHATYDATSADSMLDGDFYFNEDGAGYQVINVDGQTIKTEWTGE